MALATAARQYTEEHLNVGISTGVPVPVEVR